MIDINLTEKIITLIPSIQVNVVILNTVQPKKLRVLQNNQCFFKQKLLIYTVIKSLQISTNY
jgi:hypothetical protein